MTKQEAIDFLKANGRYIVTAEKGEEVASAFGLTLMGMGLSGITAGDYRSSRAYVRDRDKRDESVAVSELAFNIAKKLGLDADSSSPMHGRGSHHDWVAEKNAEKIEMANKRAA